MRLLDHYQRLVKWVPAQPTHSLSEIAVALCCSERYARALLGRMQSEGWIHWQPGQGRGNRSSLTLLQDDETLRLERLHHLLADGKLEAAFDGLPPAGRDRLMQSLPGYLGANQIGKLRIPFYRPLHALDPIHINRRTEMHIIMQICAGLTEYDQEREQIIPALAHHWESSNDGRSWQFWLRPGLRFHDGRPLRAEDAAETLARIRDTVGPYRALFRHVDRIEGRDLCLSLRLKSPDHLLLNRLAHHCAAILPAGDWNRKDFAMLPVGAGPFRLVRNNELRASFAVFEGYFRERPLLDEIDLWVVPNGSPLPEVDLRLAHDVPGHSAGEPDRWNKMRKMEQGCDFLLLNPARPEFARSEDRLAFGAWIRKAVALLSAAESRSMAAGALLQWQHLPKVRPIKPKLPARLTVVTYELDRHIALMHCVVEQLRQTGIAVEVHILPYSEFGPFAWREWADIAIGGEVLDNDMEFGLFSWLAGESLFNQWMDKPARRWLTQASADIASEADTSKRTKRIEESFARIVAEGWMLPMRHTRHGVDYASHLGGIQLTLSGWMSFRRLWIRT